MMSTLNLLVFLNSYADSKSSNSPTLSNFRWSREIDLIPAANSTSQSVVLQVSETKTIFTGAAIKKFVYIESDQHVTLTINGVSGSEVKPFVIGTTTAPGIFMQTSDITSLVVINTSSTSVANLFVATVE
jgi:hypothetical protein